MAESIASEVLQRVLDQISVKTNIDKISPYFGGKTKLQDVEQKLKKIQNVIFHAQKRGEMDNVAVIKVWLKRLKRLLYNLEDIFEALAMVDHVTKQRPEGRFPRIQSFGQLFREKNNKGAEGDDIRNELEEIVSFIEVLNLSEGDNHEGTLKKRESYDFINTSAIKLEDEEVVIGRDDDKNEIVKMVLDDSSDHLSVISIIGVGGIGKTAVAKLVYNEETVGKNFDLKSWVCISEICSLQELVVKILESLTGGTYHQLNVEQLQTRLTEAVSDKKYLLVLDDVWDKDGERWLRLKNLLCEGKPGCKVIVTTRSRDVADNMGSMVIRELEGLAEDKSWDLFRKLAFKEGHEKSPNLMSIGEEIVKKCANVPLVIRTVAGLLYVEDAEEEWRMFQEKELQMVAGQENNVLSTLKLSYNHLPSHLKQCLAYCSLFPKDYEFEEQDLIYLWMAHDFIRPTEKSQSLEDVGHSYFMELLRRSFFQDGRRHELCDVLIYKMHDLMNDLTRDVAGDECMLLEKSMQNKIIGDNTRHVSFIVNSSWEAPPSLLAAKQLRSFLALKSRILSPMSSVTFNEIFSSLRSLRALDLVSLECELLPDSIEGLSHLRYLRLPRSLNNFPNGITRLLYLKTLDLRPCRQLTQLPQNFNKLISLWHLHNETSHNSWIHMPPGFGQLTSLRTLDAFVVGENSGLDALVTLTGLAGKLKILFEKRCGQAKTEASDEILKNTKVTDLELTWLSSYREPPSIGEEDEDEYTISCLQPPQNLTSVKVHSWKGANFPSWRLTNIVSISLTDCYKCQHLPAFSQLHHLRYLWLCNLKALEYIEIVGYSTEAVSSAALDFRCLEHLELRQLPELKGWYRVKEDDSDLRTEDHQHLQVPMQLNFHCLSKLQIVDCPALMSFPLEVPQLESLNAYKIHDKLAKPLREAARKSPRATEISVYI